jgi:hypothetical protein
MTNGRDVVPRHPGLPVKLEVDSRWRPVRRAGAWEVPAHLKVVPGPGIVVLNMLQATAPRGGVIRVEVEGHGGSGTVLVIIPDGWGVDVVDMQHGAKGELSVDEQAETSPGMPTVILTGVRRHVSVKVRGRRWWDAWFNARDAH